ncbi:EscU/YscU/HrcU family type III secretion system export apparatus switch protein [Benzoatithermus flavus]|uniref:Flagellar type III secretion system protein FlhB n=1 Tax=Benzoatithermus flavus TaxID=3108223 RepID=A0ABU8XUW8_9PROT
MAEEGAPRDERTEEATPHRLEEARRRGNVPFSREPAQVLILLAALVWAGWILPDAGPRFLVRLAELLDRAGEIDLDGSAAAMRLLLDPGFAALGLLAPFLVLTVLAPWLSAFAQRSVVLTGEKLAPDLARLDPLAGLKRLASARNLVEFAKSTLKVAAAAAVVVLVLRREVGAILQTGTAPPAEALALLVRLVVRVLAAVLGLSVVIGAIDVLWQHLSWRRSLMMTRQELKDELKSTEGNPEIKARLRQLQRERSRRRMLADVPRAAVVVTNPTHFAVALGYDAQKEPVPRVLAKGKDAMALKIRRIAEDAKVPVVEDPPVARMLHASLEIGDIIRPEHYKAVASIIGFVLGRRRRDGSARAQSNP